MNVNNAQPQKLHEFFMFDQAHHCIYRHGYLSTLFDSTDRSISGLFRSTLLIQENRPIDYY
jgi:hypothetical protein